MSELEATRYDRRKFIGRASAFLSAITLAVFGRPRVAWGCEPYGNCCLGASHDPQCNYIECKKQGGTSWLWDNCFECVDNQTCSLNNYLCSNGEYFEGGADCS
jgi:hypothetical protein